MTPIHTPTCTHTHATYPQHTYTQVFCRHLGYTGGLVSTYLQFGEGGPGPTWLDALQCSGNESDITECGGAEFRDYNCSHLQDVGVVCQGMWCALELLLLSAPAPILSYYERRGGVIPPIYSHPHQGCCQLLLIVMITITRNAIL